MYSTGTLSDAAQLRGWKFAGPDFWPCTIRRRSSGGFLGGVGASSRAGLKGKLAEGIGTSNGPSKARERPTDAWLGGRRRSGQLGVGSCAAVLSCFCRPTRLDRGSSGLDIRLTLSPSVSSRNVTVVCSSLRVRDRTWATTARWRVRCRLRVHLSVRWHPQGGPSRRSCDPDHDGLWRRAPDRRSIRQARGASAVADLVARRNRADVIGIRVMFVHPEIVNMLTVSYQALWVTR